MVERSTRIAGSFNPPGLHHRRIVERLAECFDEVIVVPQPCGAEVAGAGLIPSTFLAALCDITFGGLARVTVDLSDLEAGVCSSAEVPEGCFGVDEPTWEEMDQASAEIRDLILHGCDASHLLVPRAWDCIRRYGLYRGANPSTWARGSLEGLKCVVQCAAGNEQAQQWAAKFAAMTDEADPSFVAVLGGDGTMLRAIRDHWRRRLPFFGVNAGHVGFLLNAPEQVFEGHPQAHYVVFRQLPLIYVELETLEGEWRSTYAFNDSWVERASSQSAWVRVEVNAVPRIEKLVCDGALVCTAAGSTAYARAMGAAPLLADTPAWLLVGSNVMEPTNWKSALLSPDTSVEITNLDAAKRPLIAYVDGVAQGPVKRLRARLSRAGSVELAFLANRDMAEKIANIQFGR